MNKFERLKEWLAQFPEGSDINGVITSNWEEDAMLIVKTPDGEIHSREILGDEEG